MKKGVDICENIWYYNWADCESGQKKSLRDQLQQKTF